MLWGSNLSQSRFFQDCGIIMGFVLKGDICGVMGRGAFRVWDTRVGFLHSRQAGTNPHFQCSARSSQKLAFLN